MIGASHELARSRQRAVATTNKNAQGLEYISIYSIIITTDIPVNEPPGPQAAGYRWEPIQDAANDKVLGPLQENQTRAITKRNGDIVPETPGEINLAAEVDRLRARVRELEQEAFQWRMAHQELEQDHRFSEMVINSMHDAIYVVSGEDYRITDCNEVFLERSGLKRGEVIGLTCYQAKRGRATPCLLSQGHCPSLDTFITGKPSRSERSATGVDGLERFYECTTMPVPDQDGRVTQIVHVDRDITARKVAEEKTREANSFLRNLINSSVDAIIASDMTGQLLIFNQATVDITGYSELEALSTLKIWDIYVDDGAREIMRGLRSKDHGGKGKLKNHETEIKCKDGSMVPIMLSAAVVMDGDNEVATVGFFYDLREKKRMERELDNTRVQLLQAAKMASIGRLAAGVAHQLNNPLAGITLFANILLEEYELEDQAKDDIQRILDNADRSRDTVKELLQFARQTSQEIRPVNINEALARTLFLLENQSHFQNIEIVRDFAENLPEVPADIQQLNHVFMNVVLNAADAIGGDGCIEVHTSRSADGKNAVIKIADNGPGIPEELLPRLFEPFFTTKEEGQGTGLGLSVAYGIMQNHKGRITAHNRPMGGAVFTIELPMSSGEEGDLG